MEMRRFEKRFVNSRRHSERVADRAEARVAGLAPKAGQRLLEVGCGNGAAAIQLAKALRLEVVGIDVDPEQIDAAEAAAAGLAGIRFLVADAARPPSQTASSSSSTRTRPPTTSPDWPRAVAEMARVLAPGGRLIYSDFVVPAGRRRPTRLRFDAAAAAGGLEREQHGGSPFHYTAVFRRPVDSTPQPRAQAR